MAKNIQTPKTLNVIPFDRARAKAGAAKTPGKKYRYPKELLMQDYFCLAAGVRKWPSMSLGELANPHWQSPLAALLEELKRDGHDVQAALIEYRAFLEGARAAEDLANKAKFQIGFAQLPIIRDMLSSS